MDVTPVGAILPWAGPTNTIPKNFKLCNGDRLDRTLKENQDLFDAIGTTWGGDGANSFYLPDLQGVFLRGVSGASGRDPDADKRIAPMPSGPNPGNQGNAVGSFQPDAMQAHKHDVTFIRDSICGSNRTHDVDGGGEKWNADPNLGTLSVAIGNPAESTAGPVRHGAETRPKNAYVYWIIRWQ